ADTWMCGHRMLPNPVEGKRLEAASHIRTSILWSFQCLDSNSQLVDACCKSKRVRGPPNVEAELFTEGVLELAFVRAACYAEVAITCLRQMVERDRDSQELKARCIVRVSVWIACQPILESVVEREPHCSTKALGFE